MDENNWGREVTVNGVPFERMHKPQLIQGLKVIKL